jgi:hypothetical protein
MNQPQPNEPEDDFLSIDLDAMEIDLKGDSIGIDLEMPEPVKPAAPEPCRLRVFKTENDE